MILLLLISHFVGDFVLQSRKIATTKSSNLSSLLIHLTILFCSLIPISLYLKISLFIPLLYCILHGIQDWFINLPIIKAYQNDMMGVNYVKIIQ